MLLLLFFQKPCFGSGDISEFISLFALAGENIKIFGNTLLVDVAVTNLVVIMHSIAVMLPYSHLG